MVGESREIYAKQVLVEKHTSGIMYENPGGTGPLAPSADAYDGGGGATRPLPVIKNHQKYQFLMTLLNP